MEFLDIFIRRLASKESSASKNTIKNYISDVRHFINWYEKSMKRHFEANSITPDVISLYHKVMGGSIYDGGYVDISSKLGVSSIKRHMSSLRKFFSLLKAEGVLSYNPFDNIEADVDESPTDYWHLRSFADYLFSCKASKITVKNYISDIQGFAKWYEQAILPGLNNPLTLTGGFYLITQEILNEYKKRLIQIQNAAPRTINRKLSALRRYISFAQKQGFISQSELYLDPVKESDKRTIEATQPSVMLKEIKTQEDELVKKYSAFPPFRLIQKILIYPYLAFEIKAADIIAGIIAGTPVSGLQKLPQRLQKEISYKNVLRSSSSTSNSIFGVSGVQKQFFEPHKVSLLGKPLHQKIIYHARYTRPSWYHKYHNMEFVHYAHFAILIIFASAVGVALYNNLVYQNKRQASAAPTSPSRVLSFQGRLTDNLDNPITTPKQVRFMIYNDASATGSANLWEELRTVQPDQDGIFSVVLGSDSSGNNGPDCSPFPLGSPATGPCEIPSTVFSDNSGTWLGVTIENTPELTPRQRIATVAYASNSEFLQGLPPITSLSASDPKTNTVLALDSSGNLTIGGNTNPAPIFQATDGQFTLSGKVLLLKTVTGTDTNVVISPDGFGKIDLTKALINNSLNGNLSPGAVEVNDKFAVLATESAVAAFVINNNTTGGDIFTASSSGTTRFTIANDGQITGSYYSVNGGIIYTTNGIFNQTTAGSGGQCLQSTGGGTPTWGACGSGANWNIANGTIYPINETLDLLVGGTSTATAKFRVLNMNTGTPVASVSANSSNNATFISGDGNIGTTNRQTLTIGNSSGFNTTGNVLFNSNGIGNVGFFTTNPRASFDVRGISGTEPAASISANTSFAALLIDNSGTGDFLTASKGGQIYFRMSAENGNYFGTDYDGTFTVGKGGNGKLTALVIDPVIVSNQKTTGTQSLTLHTSGSTNADFIFQNVNTELARLSQAGQLNLAIQGSTGGLVIGGDTHIYRGAADRLDLSSGDSFNVVSGNIQTGGVTRIDSSGNGFFTNLTVSSCSGCGPGGSASPFQELTGTIVPLNSTLDLLIGGQSTSSAKFAVLNINSGIPTASISANITDNYAYVSGNGIFGTTNAQTLTLGGAGSGNIFIDSGTGLISLNDNTDITGNLDISGTITSGTGNAFQVDANGNISSSGTTGISLSGADADITFASGTNTISSGGTLQLGAYTLTGAVTGNSQNITGLNNLSAAGTITFSGFTGANNGGIIYANSSGVLSQTAAGSGTQCLLGGTTPTWGSCGTGTTPSPFQELSGTIAPLNSTLDTLLGGQSSSSAILRVLGSANPFAGTEIATYISSKTSAAALVVDNSGVGDILAASASGTLKFAVTSAGGIRLGTSEGSSGQCLQSGGAGLAASWGPCASQTPWTSDIDADGYDLTDLSNLLFRETTGAPTGTDVGLYRDNSGDLNLNVLTGKTFNIQVNGSDEYNFSSTALSMNSNNITGVGTDITAAAALSITTTTTGALTLDSGTTGAINIGTGANAKTLTIGNTASTTGIDINVGSGELDLGDTASTKTIEIGGVDSSGTDTIRIATNGSSPDTIEIGNTNATLSLTGNNWNIDSSGNLNLGGILQVGSTTGTTYSRLGTATTGHSLSGAEDLLISGDLEVNGTAWFDGNVTITGTCTGCGGGGGGGAFDVLSTGVTVQKNQTTDLLIGASSTSSAKFAVLNVNGSGPATASVSGNLIVMHRNGAGGNVGIGTESPFANLHILDVNNDANLNIETQGTNKAANLNLYSTIGNYGQISHFYSGIKQWTIGNNGDTIGSFGIYNTSNNINRFLILDNGNVGIGTTSPISQLHITRPLSFGTTGKALVVADQIENQDIFSASSSGITRFVLTNSGSIGLGLTDAPVGKLRIPEAKLDVFSSLGTSPAASFSAQTSDAVLKIVQNGSGDLIVASKSGATFFRVTGISGDDGGIPFAGELHVGLNATGKIYAGVQDPPYTIEGIKFATYAPSVLGLYEEYIGKTVIEYDNNLKAYAYKLDFNNFEPHSDLWVFNRIIDPDVTNIKITITPNSNARTWYKKDGSNRVIVLYSDRPTEISYRLSALRFNHAEYPTLRKSGPIGYIPPPPVTSGSGSGNNNINADPFFDTLVINHNNGQWKLYDSNNNELNFVEAYSRAIIANIKAGLVNAQQITANGLNATTGFIGNLSGNTLTFVSGSFNNITSSISNLGNATASTLAITTNNLTIAGQTLTSYIENVVANYLAGQPISPLASSDTIKTNVISPLADSASPSLELSNSRINIQNENQTVSWFDIEGNASFSGTLTANRIETNNASVSSNLAARSIQTNSLEATDASVSGTFRTNNLIAENIQGLDAKIGTLAAVLNGSYNPASGSGEYSTLFAGIVNAQSINADFGIFEQGITSMGPITASHIAAIDTLSIGSNMTISNNAINTLGAELAFQSLRQADITFQGGLIRMDTDGNMQIAGNLNLLGKIDAVFGIFSGSVTTPALATNLITPLPGNDITLKLTQNNASNSARFIVANNNGQEVLSINDKGDITSSGTATLSKLKFNLVGEAKASTLTEAIATGSAGFATLRAYQPEITIKNPNITKDSLIYITPFGNTNNKVLYLLRQTPESEDEEGSFTVGASGTLPTQDIQFNWLIVN